MTDRELDALVAEKVCGWTDIHGAFGSDAPHPLLGICPEGGDADGLSVPPDRVTTIPWYSTNMGAAWIVVEAMRAKGWLLSLDADPDGTGGKLGVPRGAFRWHVMFWSEDADKDEQFGAGNWPSAWDPSAPRAICRAALDAHSIRAIQP